MLQWVREAIRALPSRMADIIKFNCMSGLRPSEAIQAVKLINNPEHLKTYYNASNETLLNTSISLRYS
jgi:hypothetical protein